MSGSGGGSSGGGRAGVDPSIITSSGVSASAIGQPMAFMAHGLASKVPTRGDQRLTVDQAVMKIYGDEKFRAEFGQQLYQAGLVRNPDDFDSVVAQWISAVQESAKFNAAGKNVTPQEYIALKTTGSTALKPTTSTSKSTTLPSETEIQHAVTSMFQEQLGRDPTPNEIARYGSMLTGAARKNPQTTTETTSTDAAGNRSTTSTTSGGVDLGQVAQNLISDNPEHGVYQAATNIMDWVHQALGAAA